MHLAYLISVWLHILAATVWIGGMFFLVLVVVPWMRRGKRAEGAAFLREIGGRFRNVGWTCFGIALATGAFNLSIRGVRWADFGRVEWLRSPFGHIVMMKLGVFALVLVVSAIHDFWIGPRATRELERTPHSAGAERLRRWASWIGRTNALLALILVAFGVVLVRG